jgi:hypothetical protein
LIYLVVSFTSDWLYPSYHSKELVSALSAVGADVSYLNIQSTWGHDAFLLEVETMTQLLTSFLDRLVKRFEVKPPASVMLSPAKTKNLDKLDESLRSPYPLRSSGGALGVAQGDTRPNTLASGAP